MYDNIKERGNDTVRGVVVGKVPDAKSQVEQITMAIS